MSQQMQPKITKDAINDYRDLFGHVPRVEARSAIERFQRTGHVADEKPRWIMAGPAVEGVSFVVNWRRPELALEVRRASGRDIVVALHMRNRREISLFEERQTRVGRDDASPTVFRSRGGSDGDIEVDRQLRPPSDGAPVTAEHLAIGLSALSVLIALQLGIAIILVIGALVVGYVVGQHGPPRTR